MTPLDVRDVNSLKQKCGCTKAEAQYALLKYGNIDTASMRIPMNPRLTPDNKNNLLQSADKLLLQLRNAETGEILWEKDFVEQLRLNQSILSPCGDYKLCGDKDGDVQLFMANRVWENGFCRTQQSN